MLSKINETKMSSVLTGYANCLLKLSIFPSWHAQNVEHGAFVQSDVQQSDCRHFSSGIRPLMVVMCPHCAPELTRLSGIDTWHEKRRDFQLPVAASITPFTISSSLDTNLDSFSPAPPKLSPLLCHRFPPPPLPSLPPCQLSGCPLSQLLFQPSEVS